MSVGPKAFRNLLLAALLGLLAFAAAPAISSKPYLPGAVDFEQRLEPLARVSSGAAKSRAAFRSPVIEAPQRFDLVGLAGETRPLELRGREQGGAWTKWVAAEDGSPVYFGGADELQLRSRGWRPRGTLHYVNVSGTASTASTVLTRFREAVNNAFISAGALVAPAADAAPTRPELVSRADWGANLPQGGCPPRERPGYGHVKAAVIHHTVSATKYTPAEAPGIVLGICRYHRNANGWNDIGYNALVDRFGTLYVGRAGGLRKSVIGAQAQGFNAQTTAIASIGSHTDVGVSTSALDSIVSYLAWKLSAHSLPAQGKTTLTSAGGAASRFDAGARVRMKRIIGHRDVGFTACPGEALYAQLAQIRRLTQMRIDQGAARRRRRPTTTPAAWFRSAPTPAPASAERDRRGRTRPPRRPRRDARRQPDRRRSRR